MGGGSSTQQQQASGSSTTAGGGDSNTDSQLTHPSLLGLSVEARERTTARALENAEAENKSLRDVLRRTKEQNDAFYRVIHELRRKVESLEETNNHILESTHEANASVRAETRARDLTSTTNMFNVPSPFSTGGSSQQTASNIAGGGGGGGNKFSREAMKDLADQLECPVCLEMYNDTDRIPCTFTCGHSCCIDHIPMLNERCPKCRAHIPRRLEHVKPAIALRSAAALLRSMQSVAERVSQVGGLGSRDVSFDVPSPQYPQHSSTQSAPPPRQPPPPHDHQHQSMIISQQQEAGASIAPPLPELPADAVQEQRIEPLTVIAVHRYEAQEPNQLSFEKGERILVVNQDPSGWWIGKKEMNDDAAPGRVGVLPSNYVREVVVVRPQVQPTTEGGGQQDEMLLRQFSIEMMRDEEDHHEQTVQVQDVAPPQRTPMLPDLGGAGFVNRLAQMNQRRAQRRTADRLCTRCNTRGCSAGNIFCCHCSDLRPWETEGTYAVYSNGVWTNNGMRNAAYCDSCKTRESSPPSPLPPESNTNNEITTEAEGQIGRQDGPTPSSSEVYDDEELAAMM